MSDVFLPCFRCRLLSPFPESVPEKNLAALDQFVSPTAVNHTVPAGLPQGPSQFLSMHLSAFPDVKASVMDLLADGDKVVEHWGLADRLSALQQLGIASPPA